MRTLLVAITILAGTCGLTWLKDKPAVSGLSAQPLEWADVLGFLGVHAFKVRVSSEQPFNSLTIRLAWFERQGNGGFRRHAIGEDLEVMELQKIRDRIVSVLWRTEDNMIRFQINSPQQGRAEFTVPAQRLADYVPADRSGGTGMTVGNQTILAVKWRKSEHGSINMVPDTKFMDGYIAIEFELRDLKGVGD
jgi:hypothetical protein